MQKMCIGCDDPIEAKDTKTKYCSRKCAAKHRTPSVRRKCKDGVSICTDRACLCQIRRPKCNSCGLVFSRASLRAGKCVSFECAGSLRRAERNLSWERGDFSADGGNGRARDGLAWWAKEYLYTKQEGKCSQCGWNEVHPVYGRCPLEINHIDGDRKNNYRDNIELICPNCHSLTLTYRGLNQARRKPTKRP